MLKQFTVLGIVLLIAGGIGLVRTLPYHSEWAAMGVTPKATLLAKPSEGAAPVQVWPMRPHDDPNDFNDELIQLRGVSQQTLRTQQQARLQADIDRLAAGEKPAPGMADMLYGPNWEAQVSQYKSGKEHNESILTGSFVLALVGLTVFVCCVVIGTMRLVLRIAHWTAGKIEAAIKSRRATAAPVAEPAKSAVEAKPADAGEQTGRPRGRPPERGRERITVDVPPLVESEPVPYQRTYPASTHDDGEVVGVSSWASQTSTERLLSDEQTRGAASLQTAEPAGQERVAVDFAEAATLQAPTAVQEFKESLAVQTVDLERQLAEFKAMIQASPKAETASTEPFNQTLVQLNDHISAIRQYAADQQRQVEKLQGGYDWTIIRTFCLRVIRCIDNLEDRIARLTEDDETVDHLNQVREELLFALESSGVEPFEPEVNSVFQGQERGAEAIKDKEPCDDPAQKGRVAEVIKPGYQYIVDDQNMKLVRAARVKLYG
jgi:molecular chaperone GrpE (heat shock protein)